MPPTGFEPAIPAIERTQTYALDCKATGIAFFIFYSKIKHETLNKGSNFTPVRNIPMSASVNLEVSLRFHSRVLLPC